MTGETWLKIQPGQVQLQSYDAKTVGSEPVAWLHKQAAPGMFLLAHADDGVIWGRFEHGEGGQARLVLPPAGLHEQPPLRDETLLMARLFDDQKEHFLWRVEEGAWCARSLRDMSGESCLFFDEPQVLWGTIVDNRTEGGFVGVSEGAEGLRHAPPVELLQDDGAEHPLRLDVRHYLAEDDGWLRVVYSRLMLPSGLNF